MILNKTCRDKGNVMICCCKSFKDIHIPNFMLNGVTLPRVSNCKYIGYIISSQKPSMAMMTCLSDIR